MDENYNRQSSDDEGDEYENYEQYYSNINLGPLGDILNEINSGASDTIKSTFITQVGKINHCEVGNKTTTNYYNSSPPSQNINTDEKDLSEMISTVSRRIRGKWSELIEKLGAQRDEVEDIRTQIMKREHNCQGRVEELLQKMAKTALVTWKIENGKNATCNNLILALRFVNADYIINDE